MSSRPILLRRNCGLEVMFYIRSHDSGDGSGTRALTCLSVTMVIICFLRLTIFFFCHTTQPVEYQFLNQELNLCPLQWKCTVLTTRPPKSLNFK